MVADTDPGEWELALRVPSWCADARLTAPDGTARPVSPGWATLRREWQAGDTVVLELPMPVRLTAGHPRVDAVRGCRAIERGPLVYAVEQIDVTDDTAVDDLRLPADDAGALHASWQPDLLGGCVTITGPGFTAVPYALWANREVGPMRVWLPLADGW